MTDAKSDVGDGRAAAGGRGDDHLRRPPTATDLSYEDSERRASLLLRRVGRGCAGVEASIQERLGLLLTLIAGMRLPRERGLLFDEAELALEQLTSSPPNLVLFDALLKDLRARVGSPRVQRARRMVVSLAPHVIVAAGATLAMLLSLLLTHVLLPLIPRTDLWTLQLVTEAGFLGALTSLMLRFHRIRAQWRMSNRDAFFEGLFRPFIGVFFAWMVYYLFDAQLVPLRPAAGASETSLYISLAFVTGFSERLGASFVEGITAQASGRREAEAQSGE